MNSLSVNIHQHIIDQEFPNNEKATSSIGPSMSHHKHTQTDIHTGQLIETGAEVSPGS